MIEKEPVYKGDFAYLCRRKKINKRMNQKYPSVLLENAVNELSSLPGVGRKTALRLALYMLRRDVGYTEGFASALLALRRDIKYCKVCHNICDDDVCSICVDCQRDHATVCVVENIKEVMAIENTGMYDGLYHVLGGLINPLAGISPSQLNIASLPGRIQQENAQEVILALPATPEGDTTSFYIFRQLKELPVRVTTLAKGIAIGDDLEYTDELTLGRSLSNRVEFKL